MTSEIINSRKIVESVSRVIDDEINANREGYHYDFDSAYKKITENNSVFDVCAAVALTVNKAEWDGRYSNTSKKWAKDFLCKNNIDTKDYERVRLCETHRAVFDGFTEWLANKIK